MKELKKTAKRLSQTEKEDKNKKTKKHDKTTKLTTFPINKIVFENEYQVEAIVSKRVDIKGNVQYLLKWKDYDQKFNSWEHRNNLFCLDLIEAFESKIEVTDCDTFQGPNTTNQHQNTNRVFCPVTNCLDGNRQISHGWNSITNMKLHLYEHSINRIEGQIPIDFLTTNNLCVCPICYHTISSKFGGICKKCRPEARNISFIDSGSEDVSNELPTLEEIFGKRISTVRFIPKSAKFVFVKCLTSAMANINLNNSVSAWTEFFMLPKTLLSNNYSKGKRHRKQLESHIKNKCVRWLNGERKTLWDELEVNKESKKQTSTDERQINEAK